MLSTVIELSHFEIFKANFQVFFSILFSSLDWIFNSHLFKFVLHRIICCWFSSRIIYIESFWNVYFAVTILRCISSNWSKLKTFYLKKIYAWHIRWNRMGCGVYLGLVVDSILIVTKKIHRIGRRSIQSLISYHKSIIRTIVTRICERKREWVREERTINCSANNIFGLFKFFLALVSLFPSPPLPLSLFLPLS